jgi:hypothetical protein
VSEHGPRAHWVQNLLAEPRVRWQVGSGRLSGLARVVRVETAPALVRDIQARSKKKYGWGDGLVVELDPGPRRPRRRPRGET